LARNIWAMIQDRDIVTVEYYSETTSDVE